MTFESGFKMPSAEGAGFLQTFVATFPLANMGALDFEKGALFTTAGDCFTNWFLSSATKGVEVEAEGRRDRMTLTRHHTLVSSNLVHTHTNNNNTIPYASLAVGQSYMLK